MNEWKRFDAEAAKVIPEVVARHRESGVLTWGMLQRIEAEVIDELAETGKFGRQILQMAKASPAMGYPTDNRPANFKGHEILPILFTEIAACWNRTH